MVQLALITGGAVRIGKAIALCLSKAGYDIAIQYNRSEQEAVDLAAAITQLGGRAACFGASLEKDEQVEALISQVSKAMGPLTCLVNNASHFADDRLPALSTETWREHMAVNLEAPVFLSQAFAEQLPDGENGNIVNIIDQRRAAAKPAFLFLHAQQIRALGSHPDHGPGAGAAHPRERDRPRASPRQRLSKRG